jgi:hypothetical protein
MLCFYARGPNILGFNRRCSRKASWRAYLKIIQGVRFYSAKETATMLGVTKRTLNNWANNTAQNGGRRTPTLRSVVSPNGRKFFREEDIISALSQCWGIEASPESLRRSENLVHA